MLPLGGTGSGAAAAAIPAQAPKEAACYAKLKQVVDGLIATPKAFLKKEHDKIEEDDDNDQASYYRTWYPYDCLPEHDELHKLEADEKMLVANKTEPSSVVAVAARFDWVTDQLFGEIALACPEQFFSSTAAVWENLIPDSGELLDPCYNKVMVIITCANAHLGNTLAIALPNVPLEVVRLIAEYKPIGHIYPLERAVRGIKEAKRRRTAVHSAMAAAGATFAGPVSNRLAIIEAFSKEGAVLASAAEAPIVRADSRSKKRKATAAAAAAASD